MDQTKTRMGQIIDALQTTPNAFARAHGINVPTIYGFVNGTRNPGYDVLVSICTAEPRISTDYLLRGTGSPLRDAQRVTDLATAEGLEAFKAKMVAALDKQIQELRQIGQLS